MSAKDMFYTKGTNFSNEEKKAFAKEELVYNVTEDLLVILEDLELTKKDLAQKLGKSKSYVSQVLSGARNMTLGTLSDICFAIGIKPQITLPVASTKSEIEHSNKFNCKEVTTPQIVIYKDHGVSIDRKDSNYKAHKVTGTQNG